MQNAIDACLLDCYVNEKVPLSSPFPRKWPVSHYHVYVMFSEKQNELIVFDNGIGMDMDTLRSYLFKTADSGYKHMDVNREFPFPAIAKFGIGFIACLTKAVNIRIFTQAKNSDKQIGVEIEKGRTVAFVENREKSRMSGTIIRLKLLDKCTFAEIERYLKKFFVMSSIKINLVNLDVLASDVENAGESIRWNGDLNEFHVLLYRMNELKSKMNCAYREYKDLSDIFKMCLSIEEAYYELKEDSVFPADNMIEKHRELLSGLYKDEQVKKLFTLQLNKYGKETLEIKQDEYLNLIDEVRKEYKQRAEEALKIIQMKYRAFSKDIGSRQWIGMMESSVCMVSLDSNLDIETVSYDIDKKIVKNGRGILYIKSEYEDEKVGIEYENIAIFLFYKGALCKVHTRIKDANIDMDEEEMVVSLDEIQDIDYQIELHYESEIEKEKYLNMVYSAEQKAFDCMVDAVFCDENVYMSKNVSMNKLRNVKNLESREFNEACWYNENWNHEYLPGIKSSYFYQDGILLKDVLAGLIPFDGGYYKCNFFGDARFELNITRHDINQDRTLLQNWLKTYGKAIQEAVIKNVKEVLEKCGVEDTDLTNYISKRGNSFFESCSYKQFKEILKEK